MSDYLAEVIEQVQAADADRERSQQKEIGWSAMAGCRAYMGFRLTDTWASDNTDEWGAIRGTWLHEQWTPMRRAAVGPPEPKRHPRYAWNVEVEYGGIKGHVDEVDYDAGEVTDLKTTTLKSAYLFDDPEVLDERFIQPMGYAAGVMQTQRWTFSAPKGRMLKPLVRLLVAPVDGRFEDWRVYEREFDQRVVDEALERYATVQQMQAEGLELPRDKPPYFCQKWCEFVSLCRGDQFGEPQESDLPEITDPELAAALERYGEAMQAATEADKAKKLYAPLIRGLRGQARGWRVSLSRPGQPSPVPDLEQIRADYENTGIELPMVTPEPSAPKLYVARVKAND